MANVIIPHQHQSAPSSRFPKDFHWKVWHKAVQGESTEGIKLPTMTEHVYMIMGSKGGYVLKAGFTIKPWTGDGYAEFEDRMQKAIFGICHDINVVLQGGDARGKVNLMLEGLAERAATKYDVDPALLKRHFQHQDLQERD
ncbi:MAG: hypothetical protein CEE38_23580 [Planctomycetes bacterium B3_Pla]|nr:MAG: hypothetical protein CEE38_23580 [Planctomycetes bacterium B3_Pla]